MTWRGADAGALKRSPGTRLRIFLDDGGVLSDNNVRRGEWLRLIGEYVPPRLGGTAEQWASANTRIWPPLWQRLQERFPTFKTYREFYRAYATEWMQGMCASLGIEPPREDEAVAFYTGLSVYVAERADAQLSGAADAVRALHNAGYTLYTASGTSSWELRAILGRTGVAEFFVRLYGPDLVDGVKFGAAFYRSVLADAGVAPHDALVIDSDEQCCRWASQAGAHAIWVDAGGRGDAMSLGEVARTLV